MIHRLMVNSIWFTTLIIVSFTKYKRVLLILDPLFIHIHFRKKGDFRPSASAELPAGAYVIALLLRAVSHNDSFNALCFDRHNTTLVVG
jgi:hypothetical protein